MTQDSRTHVSRMQIRQNQHLQDGSANRSSALIDWAVPPRKKRYDEFLRNLAVAAALVLCAVTLRTGVIPELNPTTDVIMTAATDQSLLDDQLGKLSFVSSLFPEAVLVFGEEKSPQLSMPVSGDVVVHAWTEQEPYMSWRTSSKHVTASASGEVTGVYHGVGDEWLVEVADNHGLSYLYGNLESVSAQTGDAVSTGDVIGELLPGKDFVFEVFRNGSSIDPAFCFER